MPFTGFRDSLEEFNELVPRFNSAAERLRRGHTMPVWRFDPTLGQVAVAMADGIIESLRTADYREELTFDRIPLWCNPFVRNCKGLTETQEDLGCTELVLINPQVSN